MATCGASGCDRETHYRQPYCKAHYARWRRHGDPLAGNRSPGENRCGVDGCDRPYRSNGYCSMHHQRLRKTGDPLGIRPRPGARPRPAEDRLWSRIEKRGADDCWPWTGWCNDGGYGQIEVDGQKRAAHRVLYVALHGPVPDDVEIRHTCDNPPCCNPAHLIPGDHIANMADMVIRGRRHRRWTDDELEAVRTDSRPCRVVAAEYGMSRSYVVLIRKQYRKGMHRSFSA